MLNKKERTRRISARRRPMGLLQCGGLVFDEMS